MELRKIRIGWKSLSRLLQEMGLYKAGSTSRHAGTKVPTRS